MNYKGMNRIKWRKMMKSIEAYKKHIDEHPEDIGPVTEIIEAKRCQEKTWLDLQCCGVHGHKGPHWVYREDGSLEQWRKVDSKGKKIKPWDWAVKMTPPSHQDYIHPKDMTKHCWRSHSKAVKVKSRKRGRSKK
jgi:hypothetical protein